jgi:hypothetical protein
MAQQQCHNDAIERVRSIDSYHHHVTGESSRTGSRRSSFSCSNRGSVSCLQEALSSVVDALQLSGSRESLDDDELFKPDHSTATETTSNSVCNSCKEENHEALSVQLARQRFVLHQTIDWHIEMSVDVLLFHWSLTVIYWSGFLGATCTGAWDLSNHFWATLNWSELCRMASSKSSSEHGTWTERFVNIF